MWNWFVTQGPTFNAVLITVLTLIPAAMAFIFLGWLGVGILGIVGLLIAVKVDLFEDSVAGDVTCQPDLLRCQVEERARRNPLEVAAQAQARERVLVVLRMISGYLAVAGFGLFGLSIL